MLGGRVWVKLKNLADNEKLKAYSDNMQLFTSCFLPLTFPSVEVTCCLITLDTRIGFFILRGFSLLLLSSSSLSSSFSPFPKLHPSVSKQLQASWVLPSLLTAGVGYSSVPSGHTNVPCRSPPPPAPPCLLLGIPLGKSPPQALSSPPPGAWSL